MSMEFIPASGTLLLIDFLKTMVGATGKHYPAF